ncbi:4-(cytidine 5'-diphospho)-2-C-methyl-D-erythritol kinase [Helicobacter sp. 11S03491-1]|uniref:4-(cytidine 5'-diphospho)-2-C-methyl-D-erythritol kinase n=1 Tax=Helicobacter sp. 11S03491-1 TaxID=1476196 RepID=UPI000BA6C1F9|nr:4-(cytidine 5'-diphospho)-2-C-methyl-D-erythritol kinase [Helicobacter sp. 11S03491-1]PAF41697.1 4-(cytidine 5'-diphospho)-2-C-methyl-D-erythritol kinase [Helicobacter sp. 11S03491-1]
MIFEVFPKVNIFLKIIGSKGSYHQISSRFVLTKGELKDIVEIKNAPKFSLKGNFGCQKEQNLIYKVILELKNYLDTNKKDTSMLECLDIEVQKGIPKGAGLGGGSADAGVCLSKINEFFNLALTQTQLRAIGMKVGADVSFFVSGYESANVSGIGEVLQKYDEKACELKIFTPNIPCDTKIVYERYDICQNYLSNHMDVMDIKNLEKTQSKQILLLHKRENLNDLLMPALKAYPKLAKIEKELGDEWFFSGSGSSFFCLKEKREVDVCSKK